MLNEVRVSRYQEVQRCRETMEEKSGSCGQVWVMARNGTWDCPIGRDIICSFIQDHSWAYGEETSISGISSSLLLGLLINQPSREDIMNFLCNT